MTSTREPNQNQHGSVAIAKGKCSSVEQTMNDLLANREQGVQQVCGSESGGCYREISQEENQQRLNHVGNGA
jgi:hypothetical protein